MDNPLVSGDAMGKWIFLIRGRRVMLDAHLAKLYGIKTIRLREQVARNRERFPADFMFQLSEVEVDVMVSQNAIPSRQHLGGHLPSVFTQEGVAMLSSVLRDPRAVQINIAIMREFIRLKEMISFNIEMEAKVAELERRIGKHDRYIGSLFKAIRKLMTAPQPPPDPPKPPIGFRQE